MVPRKPHKPRGAPQAPASPANLEFPISADDFSISTLPFFYVLGLTNYVNITNYTVFVDTPQNRDICINLA